MGIADQILQVELVVAVVVVIVGTWMVWLWYANRAKTALAIPCPASTLPLFGNTLDLLVFQRARFYDWLVENCQRFGPSPWKYTTWTQPPSVVVSTVEAIETVLKTQFESFPKGPIMQANLRDLLGTGIFAVDDDLWVHQRKISSHLFTLRALREGMTQSVQKHTHQLMQILTQHGATGTIVDVFDLFNRFTLQTFAEMGFGVHLECLNEPQDDTHQAFRKAFDQVQRQTFQRFMTPSWLWKLQRWWGIDGEKELQQNVEILDRLVYRIISQTLERHAHGGQTSGRDVVSLFLGSSEQDGATSTRWLRDVVVNFLVAGRDTTAQALTWFLVCLHQNPTVEATIRRELTDKFPQLATTGARSNPLTMDESQQLVYLEASLRETLRLHPSVPFNVKIAKQDVEFPDGTLVPQGWQVVISSYALARMRHVWGTDASEFVPERFLDATGKLKTFSPFQFTAFHAGPRMCLGKNLALLEMKIVLASVLSRFHLEVVSPPEAIVYEPSLTHPLKHGLQVRVVPLVICEQE